MRYLILIALAALLMTACDAARIPNRNVNDVSHEVRAVNDTLHHLVVDNPNMVRVGSEFRIRIFQEGQREPIHTSLEHVYVSPQMEATHTVDISSWCGETAEAAPAPAEPTPEPAEGSGAAAEGSGAPAEGSAAAAEPAGPVTCDQISVHAVLLSTYYMADE